MEDKNTGTKKTERFGSRGGRMKEGRGRNERRRDDRNCSDGVVYVVIIQGKPRSITAQTARVSVRTYHEYGCVAYTNISVKVSMLLILKYVKSEIYKCEISCCFLDCEQ
jgi:hypothetical protein